MRSVDFVSQRWTVTLSGSSPTVFFLFRFVRLETPTARLTFEGSDQLRPVLFVTARRPRLVGYLVIVFVTLVISSLNAIRLHHWLSPLPAISCKNIAPAFRRRYSRSSSLIRIAGAIQLSFVNRFPSNRFKVSFDHR